jgi:hypothetical protein
MTDDLVKRLRNRAESWLEYECEEDAKIDIEAVDRIEELEAEVERLKAKCDIQATILRRLTPDKYTNLLFIHSTLGDRDQNNMPQKLLVVPAYGVDFSYIYERTEKTTGPEW